MSKPSSILLYGSDATLLETRGWVLQQAGFEVICVKEMGEFERCVTAPQTSLVVLCHSLSSEERRTALAASASMRPTLKRVLLIPYEGQYQASGRDFTVSTLEGPRAMIAMATQLLSAGPSILEGTGASRRISL